jgi:hypothetical protein
MCAWVLPIWITIERAAVGSAVNGAEIRIFWDRESAEGAKKVRLRVRTNSRVSPDRTETLVCP